MLAQSFSVIWFVIMAFQNREKEGGSRPGGKNRGKHGDKNEQKIDRPLDGALMHISVFHSRLDIHRSDALYIGVFLYRTFYSMRRGAFTAYYIRIRKHMVQQDVWTGTAGSALRETSSLREAQQ